MYCGIVAKAIFVDNDANALLLSSATSHALSVQILLNCSRVASMYSSFGTSTCATGFGWVNGEVVLVQHCDIFRKGARVGIVV